MTKNDLMMQTQADILGVTVVRPKFAELTALGAAIAAGLALKVWNPKWKDSASEDDEFQSKMESEVC